MARPNLKWNVLFIYDAHDPGKGKLEWRGYVKAPDYKSALNKAYRCMSHFKNPDLRYVKKKTVTA